MNYVKAHDEKHEFAIFVESLFVLVDFVNVGHDLVVIDESTCHRIKNVLRLHQGDTCIFFDQKINVHVEIAEFIGRKQLRCKVISKKESISYKPSVTFLLPLLKRDDFEQALYGLTEIGVTTIQLVFTQKSRNVWDQKDYDRAQRIIISAAEQSKNFSFPVLKYPIALTQAVRMNAAITKLFFDPCGTEIFSVIQDMRAQELQDIVLFVGPEGDLVQAEKEMVRAAQFVFCTLTPTILRAVQAAIVSAGLIRTLIK